MHLRREKKERGDRMSLSEQVFLLLLLALNCVYVNLFISTVRKSKKASKEGKLATSIGEETHTGADVSEKEGRSMGRPCRSAFCADDNFFSEGIAYCREIKPVDNMDCVNEKEALAYLVSMGLDQELGSAFLDTHLREGEGNAQGDNLLPPREEEIEKTNLSLDKTILSSKPLRMASSLYN